MPITLLGDDGREGCVLVMGGSECERVLNDKKGLENLIMMSLCLENGTIEMQYGQSVETVRFGTT